MKKKLLSKVVAMATATVLVLGSNSLVAFAADDGTAADAPKDGTGAKTSSGEATAAWDTTDENQTGFNVVGDDDDTAVDGTDTQTDISIWAKVVEHGDLVYKVDISWGNMKFEFNNQAGKWNTESHQYVIEENGVAKEWTVDDFINGTNNQIIIVNHSNGAVAASFSYAHDITTGTVFNTEENMNGDSAVRGYFFKTNDLAKAAAKKIENSTAGEIENELDDALMLGHQDKSNALNYGGVESGETITGETVPGISTNDKGSCTRNVYFTFTGKPDEEKMTGAITTGFTKVGVITVTITPWVDSQ